MGVGNLIAGLLLGAADVDLGTHVVLDVIYANFGIAAGCALLVCAATLPAVRPGLAIVARYAVLGFVAAGSLALAGAIGIVFQLWNGESPNLLFYVAGLATNLGWCLLHLTALILCAQTMLRRWVGATAAALTFAGVNLAFDNLLLRFGMPSMPWSTIDGYEPFLPWYMTTGLYWSAVSALLLIVAHICARPRQTRRRRLTANAGTTAWAAAVVGAVSAGWIYANLYASPQTFAADAEKWPPPSRSMQPEYSRLNLKLGFFPQERRIAVAGRAIVVNRADVAIAELHLAFPPRLLIEDVQLTGELVEQRRSYRRFRLNRPLEPGETLRLDYAARWQAPPLPELASGAPLFANRAFLVTTDIVPTVGRHSSPSAAFAPDAQLVLGVNASAPLNHTAIAPGELMRAWREEDRAYFEYQTPSAIPALAAIHAGQYAVTQAEIEGRTIEAYHPPHYRQTQRLIAAARRKLAALDSRPIDHASPRTPFRLVVVADRSPLAPGFGPLGITWRHANKAGAQFEHLAAAGLWPYSERRAALRDAGVAQSE